MRMPKKRGVYRMLMTVRTDWEYGRNMTLGARHYAFTTGQIEVGNGSLQAGESLEAVVRRQAIDGVIAAAQSREEEEQLLALPVPAVNVSNVLGSPRLPLVTQDDRAVGRLAAEHLLACGCTTFAYWEQHDARFSQERVRGFSGELERRMPDVTCIAGGGKSLALEEGPVLIARMRKWLKKLPPQTGVFAVLDPFALHLLQAAREIGKRVPEDIAVLGAGDDEFWTDFENIPLSSVKLPAWQIGMEAAKLLERLMHGGGTRSRQAGEATPESPLQQHLPVTEVAARRSTDVLYAEDEAVTKAVAYIREHAAENIYVENVVRASGISRSGLQRRFAASLGRSLLAEIQRERIARVKTLLRTTEMKMTAVAEACDFPNTPRLHVLFRQHTGQTPGEYRAMFRRR
ncbi:AraC family transcriptional regulator [Opitutaceae bacterium TAV5]|nr:AraC family transcriptional regulator [Opitutaceae bacterium TAV5]